MFLKGISLIALVCLSSIYTSPIKNVTHVKGLADDLENWMKNLPNTLKTVPLNYLALPGSHDSFTVDITSNSEVSPDGEEILKALEKLRIARLIIANWSKTQGFNVLQHLQAGIRFFDLRLCKKDADGQLYFCHSMYSTAVESALNEMNVFLDSHPEEVVILDCQHFYNFNASTHTGFITYLQNTFGNKLIPVQSSMAYLTLANLSSNKQQVLVIYRDSVQSSYNNLWPTEKYPTPWYDTMDSDYLIGQLDKGLTIRDNTVGHVSQLILTPSLDDIIANALSTLREKCAVEFESTRNQWILNQTPGESGVNVIIADFIDLDVNEFSKNVIELNSKLNVADLKDVTLLQRIRKFFKRLF